jgi:hypothetical protein
MMDDMRKHRAHFALSLLLSLPLSFAVTASFAGGVSAFAFKSSTAFFWAD